jgi:hypothetical protein
MRLKIALGIALFLLVIGSLVYAGEADREKQIRYAYERGLFSGCVITLANDNDIAEVVYEPVDGLESTCLGVLEYADEKDFYSWDAKER